MHDTMFEARKRIRMMGLTPKDAITLAGGAKSVAKETGITANNLRSCIRNGYIPQRVAVVVWEWISVHSFVKWEEFREIVK